MAQRKSNTGWFVLTIFLVAAGVAVWWRMRKPAAQQFEFRTGTVARGDVVQLVTANGQLSPVVTVEVGSQVSGNIMKLHADFNSKVTNGQIIAELDPATFEARHIQAEGELANAKAQHTLAGINARRAEELLKNNLIPRADYDQTMALLEQAAAVRKMREASLKSAEVDLARTQIRSPVDGVVISRNMNVGQTVQASFSAPTLFQIANDLGQMEIAAMVSEADIGGVEEGQEVSFTVEAFPTRTFEGRVAQVRNQPTTNQNVVTYATIVAVPNADLKLKPGMTANVFITTAKKENVLRIPNAALRFRPPEGASVRTNVIQLASAANRGPGPAASAVATDDGSQPSGGSQASPEMRQRMLERYDKNRDGRLDESERQAMPPGGRGRGQSGGGGGSEGGFSGGRAFSRGRPEGQSGIRTIHQVITNSSGAKSVELQPVQVRTGISDGTYTELVDGPPENTTIATGLVNEIAAAPGAATQNPFGGPFGRGRPR